MKKTDDTGNRPRLWTASDAVARLQSGDMSASEEREIYDWLDEDESNRIEFEAAIAIWDRVGDLAERPGLLVETDERYGRRSRNSHTTWVSVAAAVVLLLVFSGFYYDSIFQSEGGTTQPNDAILQTTVGERQEFMLADGSEVTLNTNSKLRVHFSEAYRDIVLDYGEAFFDIQKDPQRPLRIRVGNRVVTVLGTKFNVYWSGPEVTIAVVEGLVAVEPETVLNNPKKTAGNSKSPATAISNTASVAQEVLLESGSVAVFTDRSDAIKKDHTQEVDDLQSWRFGFVRFDNEPLFRVISELNRYSKKMISIEDKSVMEIPIGGVFVLEDVNKVLDGLGATFPIEVREHFDRYTIVAAEQ